MRDFAMISADFWIGPMGKKIKNCELEAKVISFYLMSCRHANMIGFYYLPLIFITHETGIPLEGVSKGLASLIEIKFCSYDAETECAWVHEMAATELGITLKKNDNRVKHINNVYKKLPQSTLQRAFYERYGDSLFLEGPPKSLRSQDKKQEQEQKQDKKQENTIIIFRGEHNSVSTTETQKPAKDAEEKSKNIISLVKKTDPVTFTVPLRQGKTRVITDNELDEWQKNYLGVDVRQEIRHLIAWNQANPDRQKTQRGINRHIQGWLVHAQQKQNHASRDGPHRQSTWDHNVAVINAILEEDNETK